MINVTDRGTNKNGGQIGMREVYGKPNYSNNITFYLHLHNPTSSYKNGQLNLVSYSYWITKTIRAPYFMLSTEICFK